MDSNGSLEPVDSDIGPSASQVGTFDSSDEPPRTTIEFPTAGPTPLAKYIGEQVEELHPPSTVSEYATPSQFSAIRTSSNIVRNIFKYAGPFERPLLLQQKASYCRYEVDLIVDMMLQGKDHWYRVGWKGFPPTEDTWEPRKNLNKCDRLLIEFFERHSMGLPDPRMKKVLAKPKEPHNLPPNAAVHEAETNKDTGGSQVSCSSRNSRSRKGPNSKINCPHEKCIAKFSKKSNLSRHLQTFHNE